MAFSPNQKTGEIVAEIPQAAEVLEKLHIDYCCDGHRSLGDACRDAGVPLPKALQLIEEAARPSAPTNSRDWQLEPIPELIAHIVNTHHEFTKREVQRIEDLVAKVCLAHGEHRRELFRIQELFRHLSQELLAHMLKEEQVLFPYLDNLAAAVQHSQPIPAPFFGTVSNPIQMMMREHDAAGDLLRDIRTASSNYSLEPDACASFVQLFESLQGLEKDLHQHIWLENHILFPRAQRMEDEARPTSQATAG